MKKTIPILVLAMLCINFSAEAQSPIAQPPQKSDRPITGKVVSASTGRALPGAVIKIINTRQTAATNDSGVFTLNLTFGKHSISVSHLGYKAKQTDLQVPLKDELIIRLETDEQQLKEVEVVSTGYQTIPKERATGSFTLIDNKLLNRTVSPDLLSRLKGVTNGLLFDGQTGNSTGISVRGRSTIFSNTEPLIVVDNFPFEGDLNTINPNDIENVTVLKDAAAASIWGVRAGNGVIVITTKKGKFNQKPTVSFNTSLTIGDKPDLYYQPQLTSSEFIDVEQDLFNKGAYDAIINDGYSTISPVVTLLQKVKSDPSFAGQANKQIDALRRLDVRDQQSAYYYRKSTQQQYHIDLNGGGQSQTYFFSAGYDKDLPNAVSQSNDRLTLKGSNTYYLLDNKLKLTTDITFSNSKTNNNNANAYVPYLPYEQIADVNGNALTTLKLGGLREIYTDTVGKGNLLDWKYRPLDELRHKYNTYNTKLTDYRLNLGLNYKFLKSLSASVNYQFYKSDVEGANSNNKDSFYARNLINTYSQVNSASGAVTRPIPTGDLYTPFFSSTQSNYGRVQLDYNQVIGTKHELNAIAGYEIREDGYKFNQTALYGYNPETATNTQIDYLTLMPYYYGNGFGSIGNNSHQNGTVDRYISYYGNASYIYDKRYILSASYRKDESNLFGVKANQKGVPLWSAGVSWNVDKESFFNVGWLSSLQLKGTYGYNGNVNKSVSAYLTASPDIGLTNAYNTNYYNVVNPPNDNLRWERVQNINLGLYFSTKKNRLSGSLEYYIKNGVDLIGSSPIAPQTGISTFTGNTADSHANGMDIQINSDNVDRVFKWKTTAIFNLVKDEITDYKVTGVNNSTIVNSYVSNITPIKGYPISSIFAYRWAGLDALGNPQGFLNGAKSTDYTLIRNSLNTSELDFFGSSMPTIFGSLRNAFSYKMVELSFNITYKLNYFFRRNSLHYSNLFAGDYRQPDYNLRWQNPGDELKTDVPSAVYPNNGNREDFYRSSAVLVERGDHIRLQDIQLNFNLTRAEIKKLPFSNLNIYCYASNLGILWRANKKGIDPDNQVSYPLPKMFAFGLKANF